jgi:hypothetical protein
LPWARSAQHNYRDARTETTPRCWLSDRRFARTTDERATRTFERGITVLEGGNCSQRDGTNTDQAAQQRANPDYHEPRSGEADNQFGIQSEEARGARSEDGLVVHNEVIGDWCEHAKHQKPITSRRYAINQRDPAERTHEATRNEQPAASEQYTPEGGPTGVCEQAR